MKIARGGGRGTAPPGAGGLFSSYLGLLKRPLLLWLSAVSAVALLTGALAGGTFSSSWTAIDEYQSTTFSSASLGAPSGLTASASGTKLNLAWTAGANGTSQVLSGVDTSTSATCGSTQSFSPVAVLSPSTSSYADANQGGQSPTPGSYFCYQLVTTYPTSTVALSSALTSGSTVSSLSVASLPYPVASGDQIVVTGTGTQAGNGEFFVASANVAASATATSIPVTGKAANLSYTTSSTVSDVTSWAEWTATSYANSLYGLVPTAVTIANGGTLNTIGSGDTITLTFNQAVVAPATANDVCVIAPSTIIIDDATQAKCARDATTDASYVGKLVVANSSSGAKISGSGAYTASYSVTGKTLVVKITGGTGSTTSSATIPTWTYTASTSVTSSATPAATACTSSACTPTSPAGTQSQF